MTSIKSKTLEYYGRLEGDKNHRYKSWEHCYAYFCNEKPELDIASLHLAFYLASWGMYRGSSFLLWKDYLIHKEVVSHLLSKKHLQNIDFANASDSDIREILDLISWVKEWYQDHIDLVNGEAKEVNVTDTLATKILLGSLGCIPAYDQYFIKGIRHKGLSYSVIKFANFKSVVCFYKKNQSQFSLASQSIYKKSGIHYPAMKLVDMYFWQIGYEQDQQQESDTNTKQT
ncbi:MAG: hypothetical protein ABW125_07235 [Candidatus Thiodiazotropha lotti]